MSKQHLSMHYFTAKIIKGKTAGKKGGKLLKERGNNGIIFIKYI